MVTHYTVPSVSTFPVRFPWAPNETIFLRGDWTVLNLIWAGHRRFKIEHILQIICYFETRAN